MILREGVLSSIGPSVQEISTSSRGFPGGTSGKESTCQCRRHKGCRFNPWIKKIPWSRAWQPTPVFLPGESHRQRNLGSVDSESWTWLKWLSTHPAHSRDHFKTSTHFKCFNLKALQFSSVTQSCPTLQPHGLKHARPPCPSPTPRVYSNSFPLSRWCHPTISSSVIPFTSCLQSFPAPESFQMSQFFTSAGQIIGAAAPTSVLPMNIQDWFPLGWTGWTSLQSKGLSRVFFNITVQKHQFFSTQLSLKSKSHIHTWLLEKP